MVVLIKKCEVCNTDMECARANKKYCCKACESTARRTRSIENETMEKTCLVCGTNFTPKTKSANLRKCCYGCHPDGVTLTRGLMLDLVRSMNGGKCKRCNYDKYGGALEFHHLVPSEKEFTISNDRAKLEESIEESKKCILLCANCHRELHAGLFDVADIL